MNVFITVVLAFQDWHKPESLMEKIEKNCMEDESLFDLS